MAALGSVEITNNHRDTVQFPKVWHTANGKRPSGLPTVDGDKKATDEQIEAAKRKADAIDTYQLHLGSKDSDNDEQRAINADPKEPEKRKFRMPTQDIPKWALEIYKTQPYFAALIANKQITCSISVPL